MWCPSSDDYYWEQQRADEAEAERKRHTLLNTEHWKALAKEESSITGGKILVTNLDILENYKSKRFTTVNNLSRYMFIFIWKLLKNFF